jgi:hypothetical protein
MFQVPAQIVRLARRDAARQPRATAWLHVSDLALLLIKAILNCSREAILTSLERGLPASVVPGLPAFAIKTRRDI